MSLESSQELIVAKFVSAVQGFSAEARRWPEGSKLYVAEHAAWRLAREVARLLLQECVAGHHGGHRGPRMVDEAGQPPDGGARLGAQGRGHRGPLGRGGQAAGQGRGGPSRAARGRASASV